MMSHSLESWGRVPPNFPSPHEEFCQEAEEYGGLIKQMGADQKESGDGSKDSAVLFRFD